MTEMEKHPTQLQITKELFDWLYHFTDSEKLSDKTITIKGSSTIFVKE